MEKRMEEQRYKAFISYRHQSPDQEIAKRLHSLIENFDIPSSIKSTLGIRKMGRVFRDEEELPLSASLGEDIHRALDNSEWLICICSPRYLESKWCLEELTYFIASGRRDHVLAILVEGEPEQAFPHAMRFEEIDGEEVENEPLAADVRADSLAGSLSKLKNEKLRIMAPMLGVTYDDLRQRARQRRTRIAAAAAFSVIALLSSFLIYAVNKNKQINEERNAALIAESKWLSKSAAEALANNDRMLSLMLYLEALPKDLADPERPVIDEAANGLISAVIGSNATNKYAGVTEMDLDYTFGNRITDLVAIGNKIFFTSKDRIAVYDLDTGNHIKDLECGEGDIYGTSIRSEEDYLVYHKDYFEQHYTFADTRIETYEESYQYEAPFEQEDPNGYNIYTISFYEGQAEKGVYGDRNWLHTENQSWKVPDRRFETGIANAHLTGEDFLLTLYNASTYNVYEFSNVVLIDKYNEIVNEYTYTVGTTDYWGEVFDAIASPDGKVIFGKSSHHIYLWNRQSAEWFRTVSIDRFDNTEIREIRAPSQNKLTYIAVLTKGGNVYFYDYVKDEVTVKLDNGFYHLGSMMFNYDGNRILCSADYDNGLIFSCTDGSLLENLESPFPSSMAEYAIRDYYGNAKSDTYIILANGSYGYHNDRNITKMMIYSTNAGNETDKYKTVLPVSGFSEAEFSSDGKTVWLTQGGPNPINAPMVVCDVSTGKYITTIDDLAANLNKCRNRMITVPSMYDLSFNAEDLPHFRVYDEETFEEIKRVYPLYPNVYGREGQYNSELTGLLFARPQFTDDEQYMILQWDHSENLTYSQPFVFVYDTDTWEEQWHIGIYNAYDRENNSVMPETDSFEGDLYVFAYPAGNDKVLVEYMYGMPSYKIQYGYNQIAFELRDVKTGEVLDKFVPEGTFLTAYSKEREQIGLFASEEKYEAKEPEYVFYVWDFENLADTYEPLPTEEEDKNAVDYGGGVRAEYGDLKLVGNGNEYYLLKVPTLEEAMESARKVLDGRELSDAQREQYFLVTAEEETQKDS